MNSFNQIAVLMPFYDNCNISYECRGNSKQNIFVKYLGIFSYSRYTTKEYLNHVHDKYLIPIQIW
jgi:hypothetical protein